MLRGRWRLAAGLGLFFLAGMTGVFALQSRRAAELSDGARQYPADVRRAFVSQVRAADTLGELSGVKNNELVNRGAAFCTELAATRSSLQAMTQLQLAGRTHKGDVYITPPAKRHLCPGLPDNG